MTKMLNNKTLYIPMRKVVYITVVATELLTEQATPRVTLQENKRTKRGKIVTLAKGGKR